MKFFKDLLLGFLSYYLVIILLAFQVVEKQCWKRAEKHLDSPGSSNQSN